MPKLSQCIICNCHYLKQIDDMLKRKSTYSLVTKYLADKGILISKTSVMRHYHNHVLNNVKPRHIQKGNIKAAKARAQGKPKTKSRAIQTQNNVVRASQPNPRDRGEKRRKAGFLQRMEQAEKDIDVIDEMRYLMAMSKDRVERGYMEEMDTGMVLPTTGNAIKDHGKLLKDYQDITAGMDSVQQLRYAQIVNLIGNVFAAQPISDQARMQMLEVIDLNQIGNPISDEVIEGEIIEPEVK